MLTASPFSRSERSLVKWGRGAEITLSRITLRRSWRKRTHRGDLVIWSFIDVEGYGRSLIVFICASRQQRDGLLISPTYIFAADLHAPLCNIPSASYCYVKIFTDLK